MKICVLQPEYKGTDIDYQYYDPPRDLSKLWPEAQFHHEFLNKSTTYKQIRELSFQNFDIYVNLCEGYLEWDIPSIDVIYTLDLLELPYTGPNQELYDPPKDLMKYISYCEGIQTAHYAIIDANTNIQEEIHALKFPLFVKPLKSGDSLGIDQNSKVNNFIELNSQIQKLLPEYPKLLVEEYIEGREFTVLVVATPDQQSKCKSLKPVEYLFPENYSFKTYALKTSELHPESNQACNDPFLENKLRMAAEKIFEAFSGVGYARMDFRVNSKSEIFFLEVNFTCSVFYSEGFEGSADHILKWDGMGQSNFLKAIVYEGINRFQNRKKKYILRGNSLSGFGIYSTRNINKGEVIFHGEEKSQRIVTKKYVEDHWTGEDLKFFKQYAYPLSEEVYCLWDNQPTEWAPQNHSCNPNTGYKGLNVIALKDILSNEELTLDYGEFLDDEALPFKCNCGSINCRGMIYGTKYNSVTRRESKSRGY